MKPAESGLTGKGKRIVARNFARAAARYDHIAQFQRTVAERLLERLDVMRVTPELVLDLGCGTGSMSTGLKRRFPQATLLDIDLALPMLCQSRPRWFWQRRRRHWLCADAEALPLAEDCAGMAISNLMLQWCNSAHKAFEEIHRALRPQGLFIFSTLGPDTLLELRQSWAAVDEGVHVNDFLDLHDIGDLLLHAGLGEPVMEAERFTLTYDSGLGLMRDLKSLGAANANDGRRNSLTGKSRLQSMLAEYERFRADGRLPATYEVVFGHAWKAGGAAPAPRDGAQPVRWLQRPGQRSA